MTSSHPLPAGPAAAPTAVWAVSAGDPGPGCLFRMDPTTGATTARIPLEDTPTDDAKHVAATPDGVWVASELGRVHRVDPHARRVVAVVDVGPQLGRPVACAGSVWVPSGRDGGVIARIDPRTNAITGAVALAYPRALAAGGDALWASHGPHVTRIDTRTLRTLETVDLGGYVLALAGDETGAVWATTLEEVPAGGGRAPREGSRLYRLVPGAALPTPIAPMEGRAEGLCVGAGAVWVAAGALARFEPGRDALEVALDETVEGPVAVGGRVWARRYDYGRDAVEVVVFDPAAGTMAVLAIDGRPSDLAVA